MCPASSRTAGSDDASDDALVQRALSGVPGSLDLIAARYRGRLFAFALGMLSHPENAEDIAQETLIRAFGALHSYQGRGQFRAWLFSIAGNLCRDRRRLKVYTEVQLDTVMDRPSPADLEDDVSLRVVIFGAVRKLPDIYRGPVILHYMEGLSVAETAFALGRTQTAVRVQLWRARARLAKELSEFE